MAAASPKLLLPVLLLFLVSIASGLKIYKTRSEILTLLGEQEGRLYFSTCEQSSNRQNCVFALDDGYSQEPSQCAITVQENRPFWLAILETPAYITKVTVLNMDQTYRSHPDGLRGVTIMANDDVCFRYESSESFVKRSFPCDTVADQILIQSNIDLAVMALCDVEVFGAPLKFQGVLGDPSLLRVRSCLQSSVSGNGYCENAFNGDANNNHYAKPCAVTIAEATPWLEANLLVPALVTEIRLYNRADCCASGLSSFKLTLNNRLCIEHDGQFESIVLPCKYFGDSLRVTSKLNIAMSVCEMQMVGHIALLQEPEQFKILGCYKDDYKNRDFTQLVSSIIMSHEKCHKMCKRMGVKYFGVQNGKHCWCGSSYGKHGKVDNKMCTVPCDDNEKQMCGGSIYNAVFEIL